MTSWLERLKVRTQVDIDSFDAEAISESWGCTDATSNQAEIYDQITKDSNRDLLKSSVSLARDFISLYPMLTPAQLAVDICTVRLAAIVAKKVSGCIHIMSNPRHAFDTDAVILHSWRYHSLMQRIHPEFDLSRIVMKVPATWEGLQACRQLKQEGMKTLATIVFAIEQSILAGEAGCVSVSPFLHELKTHFSEDYTDNGPYYDTAVRSQAYFESHGMSTKVKSCANIGIHEIMALNGITAFTVMLPDMTSLQAQVPGEYPELSHVPCAIHPRRAIIPLKDTIYLDHEGRFRCDFAASKAGSDQYRVAQALSIFCDFQYKLEVLMEKALKENVADSGERTNR